MSDSKNKPIPDDFSKTTPNINIPKESFGSNDWEKTNYNFPAQPASSDDWGNTHVNIKPLDTDDNDFGKTYLPSSGKNNPQVPDWGMTQQNIDLSETDFAANQRGGDSRRQEEDFGGGGNYGATTPYFRLPETERQKYQNLPPTPTEKAAQAEKEQEAKGGIPTWLWVSGGLMSMFLFMIVVLLIVYFVILGNRGFEATVKGAPPGSNVLVNGAFWGVTSEDGSIKLPALKADETKKIEIIHPAYTCEAREIKGSDGVKPEPIIARCSAIAIKPGEDCGAIKLGEFDKAERCYNAALDALPDPAFTVEDLVKALNILIINFDSGKFDVPPVRLAALQKGAGFIKKLPPSVVLEVGGYTDNVGSDASNQTLSENRATAVKNALIKFGVRPEVLQTKGYGKSNPKTTNDTEEGRFFNRRINYSVISK